MGSRESIWAVMVVVWLGSNGACDGATEDAGVAESSGPREEPADAGAGMHASDQDSGGMTDRTGGEGDHPEEPAGEVQAGSAAPPQPVPGDEEDAGLPVDEGIDDGTPTFSNLYEYVFTSCRVGICHGGNTSRILDMRTRGAAYAALVNQPALPMGVCAELGKLRVEPNAPDDSLLYLKLMITAPCGQQMPAGGGLSEEQRMRVYDWIAAGALDN